MWEGLAGVSQAVFLDFNLSIVRISADMYNKLAWPSTTILDMVTKCVTGTRNWNY